jgi:hypothetical protein
MNISELEPEEIAVESVEAVEPEQATQYNLSNLYGRRNNKRPTSLPSKGLTRSGASRNIIKNTFGFKNPLKRYHAAQVNMPEQGTIERAASPIKHHVTRSISPKAKHLGGKRRKTSKKSSRKHKRTRRH